MSSITYKLTSMAIYEDVWPSNFLRMRSKLVSERVRNSFLPLKFNGWVGAHERLSKAHECNGRRSLQNN